MLADVVVKADLRLDLLRLDTAKLEGVVFVDELDGDDRREGTKRAGLADEGISARANCTGDDAERKRGGERLGLDLWWVSRWGRL